MPLAVLEAKIKTLPEQYRAEVSAYIDSLLAKDAAKKKSPFQNRRAGISHDPDFYMAPDFDEPLDDFKEYM